MGSRIALRLPGFLMRPVSRMVGGMVEKAFVGLVQHLVEGLVGLAFLCSALVVGVALLSLSLVLRLLDLPSLALASLWLLLAAAIFARISLQKGSPGSWREDARTGLDVGIAALLAYLVLYCHGASLYTSLLSSRTSLLGPVFTTSSLLPLSLLLGAALATRLFIQTISEDNMSCQAVDIVLAALLSGLLLCWKGLSLHTGLVIGAALVLANWEWSHRCIPNLYSRFGE